MKLRLPLKVLSYLLIFTFFLLGSAPQVGAFFLEDWARAVKDTIFPPSKEVSINAKVERLLSGDENKNGVIDGGDIVTFKYTIKNPTDAEISFATLKTNIDKSELNYIHNIEGTSGLKDDGKTIEIPNLRIGPHQVSQVSFDARINYVSDQDFSIVTEPEFFGRDKKSIAKSIKAQLNAKKIKKENIPGVLKLRN